MTVVPSPEVRRGPGRPRSESVKKAVLAATLALIDEVGFRRLTIEGVAARARCGKATIYRWWPNKGQLVMEAFLSEDLPQTPYPDTGSVREDFRRQMQMVARLFESAKGRQIAMLIGSGQDDPELLGAFREQFLAVRRAEAVQILLRGTRRGELRGEVFSEIALDALYGPLFFRLLSGQGGLTPDYVDALCDLVMVGLSKTK